MQLIVHVFLLSNTFKREQRNEWVHYYKFSFYLFLYFNVSAVSLSALKIFFYLFRKSSLEKLFP